MAHLSLAWHGASSPVLARLGLTLLHTIWEGTLAAALLQVTLIVLRGRSPQVRYLAGCVAALAMMVGMALTFCLVPASGTFPLSPSAERGRNGLAATAASDVSSPAGSSAGSGPGVLNSARSRATMVSHPFLTEGRNQLATWCQRGATLLPPLALAWAVGVLALAGRLIVGYVGVRRLCSRGTSPMEPCWQQRLLALARRMRIDRPVSLRQSTGVTTPAVVGWLRPVILLPVGMCAGLSTAQVEMILAHELAHVGRQDYVVHLLLNVVETVLFYHPAVWWIAARVREERENACDDLALAAGNDDRLGYARALASLEEMRLPVPPLALAARGDNGTLLTRVRRLLGTPDARAHAFPSGKTACGLAGTVILSGAVAALLIVAGLVPAHSQEAAGPAVTPTAGAPSLADQFERRPQPAREQMTTRVKVTDDAGKPVAGAEVRIRGIRPTHAGDYLEWKDEADARTDAQGDATVTYPRYVEEKRSTGTLCLLVKHPDFCDQEADWHVDGDGAAPKPVPLVRGAIIRVCGHLPDSTGGAARPVIYPELVVGRFASRSMQDWQKLDDNAWENRKVAPGSYYLRAAHANADGTILFSGVQQITAVKGQTYTFDLELRRGERVAGRLDDSVPRPIVRGRVIAHLYESALGQGAKYLGWDTWRTVAPDGTFVFESLPAGTVEITAQCAGFVSANPSKGNHSDDELTLPQSFGVTPGATNSAVVKMEPTATVEVEVRNEAGQPVNGARVCFFPNVKFTPGFTTILNENPGRDEDAVRAGPNVEPPEDDPAKAGSEAFQARTDGSGSAAIPDLPAGKESLYLMDDNYELPAITFHGYNRRQVEVILTPGEKKRLVVQVQKKGKDPLTDGAPVSSPQSGPTATPAPSPAAPAVALPPGASGSANEPSVPASTGVSTDDKSRREEVTRLGAAAMRGEYAAIDQLAKIAAAAREMNADERRALYADFRRTFSVFGAEAGRGNATALHTIQQASHLDELQGFAAEALGQAAGMGNAEALKPLLDPEDNGILRSSAVAALKPAADAGNVQAIAVLAATAADPKLHALWFLVADGLSSAAGAGNTTAIDTVAALAADKNKSIHRTAILALEVAADKGYPSAREALRKLSEESHKEGVSSSPSDPDPMELNKHAPTTAVLAPGAVGTTIAQGEVPVSPEVRRPTKVAVRILADGTYKVGGASIAAVDLPVALRVLVGLPDKPEIILSAAYSTPYKQVVLMLDACRDAGLTNVAALVTPAKAPK